VAFAASLYAGKAVGESEPSGQAAAEMAALAAELTRRAGA
jgi:hypothetical protein